MTDQRKKKNKKEWSYGDPLVPHPEEKRMQLLHRTARGVEELLLYSAMI
jgi:hypothetical protein